MRYLYYATNHPTRFVKRKTERIKSVGVNFKFCSYFSFGLPFVQFGPISLHCSISAHVWLSLRNFRNVEEAQQEDETYRGNQNAVCVEEYSLVSCCCCCCSHAVNQQKRKKRNKNQEKNNNAKRLNYGGMTARKHHINAHR